MSIQTKTLIVLFVLSILIYVFNLLRRKKINEAMTLWWIFIGTLILFLTLNQKMLHYIKTLLGINYPISVFILLSLIFVLFMLIYFSMKISVLSNQVKELAQSFALLENSCKTGGKSKTDMSEYFEKE